MSTSTWRNRVVHSTFVTTLVVALVSYIVYTMGYNGFFDNGVNGYHTYWLGFVPIITFVAVGFITSQFLNNRKMRGFILAILGVIALVLYKVDVSMPDWQLGGFVSFAVYTAIVAAAVLFVLWAHSKYIKRND